jgi:hypothetical protein
VQPHTAATRHPPLPPAPLSRCADARPEPAAATAAATAGLGAGAGGEAGGAWGVGEGAWEMLEGGPGAGYGEAGRRGGVDMEAAELERALVSAAAAP